MVKTRDFLKVYRDSIIWAAAAAVSLVIYSELFYRKGNSSGWPYFGLAVWPAAIAITLAIETSLKQIRVSNEKRRKSLGLIMLVSFLLLVLMQSSTSFSGVRTSGGFKDYRITKPTPANIVSDVVQTVGFFLFFDAVLELVFEKPEPLTKPLRAGAMPCDGRRK